MSNSYLLVAALCLVGIVAVFVFERRRLKRRSADAITIFMVILILQSFAAGGAIFALLPFVDPNSATGVYAFDRIYRAAEFASALSVVFLAIGFVVSFYVGCAWGRTLLPSSSEHRDREIITLVVRRGALLAVVAFGLIITLILFVQLGDDVVMSYANLVLFRDLSDEITRDAFNANAFALVQTWSWLAVFAISAVAEWRGRRWLLWFCVPAVIVFALMGVSRRAIFIPLLMLYFTSVLYTRRWNMKWIIIGCVPLVLLLAFGKDTLSAVGAGGGYETAVESYNSWDSAILRAVSDVGITTVESLGTLNFLDMDVRLGLDHLIAMVKILPEESLGFDFDYPERIVRISTTAFSGSEAQDIPPGLFGQMWLDFRIFGPIVWGLVFGLQMSVVQYFFERTQRSRSSAALLVLIIFIVALPLNTGSFDFTFSVDIVAIVVVLLCCVKLVRERLPQARIIGLSSKSPLVMPS
jgi:hypothetical protein